MAGFCGTKPMRRPRYEASADAAGQEVLAVEEYSSLPRPCCGHVPKEGHCDRRLAAPRLADKPQHFGGRKCEADAGNRPQSPGGGRVVDRKVGYLDHRSRLPHG